MITAIALAIACLFVPTLKASGTAQTDVFLTDVDSIAGQQALERALSRAVPATRW